ncbi:MAG: ATP-binding protein [Peptococcaceae bacterium]|nr:ATP-binding protein [Peptococcaceae bacterium]
MKKRIFLTVFATAILTLVVSLMLLAGVSYRYIHQETVSQMMEHLDLLSQAVEADGEKALEGAEEDAYRITWIDDKGKVVFDNRYDTSKMESHANREEFKQAQKNGRSEVERESETMTARTIYAAQRLDDGSVLRVALKDISLEGVLALMVKPTLLLVLCVLVLTLLVAQGLSRGIVKPLNTLDLDHPLENDTYEELMPLLLRMDEQHRAIHTQGERLNRQREEFQTVVDNMKEGLVLLNRQAHILVMNRSAMQLLDVRADDLGNDFLAISRGKAVQKLLNKVFDGKNARTTTDINGRDYEIHGSPVFSAGEVDGIVLFYLDVTERLEAEQMRREFSANVSHELKTPLHSISGCAELMLNNMVKDEDKPQFLQQIYDEAQHMVALVENIISISKLDETSESLPTESIDLLDLAQATINQLMPHAKMKNLSVKVSGDHVSIKGVHTLLQEMVYNLCDNAIKYNRDGGSVAVSVIKSKDEAILKVKDTGCGIPGDEQERVFERFYRVDKSHARSSGGTGLGLSIVKHAAIRHNATIKVKSKVGKGTTMTVRFPLKKKKK